MVDVGFVWFPCGSYTAYFSLSFLCSLLTLQPFTQPVLIRTNLDAPIPHTLLQSREQPVNIIMCGLVTVSFVRPPCLVRVNVVIWMR